MAQAETLTRVRTPAPLQMPRPVREAWGDAATDAFTDWMEVVVLPRVVPRDEYREILSRMDVLESRMDGLDGRMDRLEQAVMQNRAEFHQRLDGMEAKFDQRLDGLRAEFDQRLDGMGAEFHQRLDGMEAKFDQRLDGLGAKFDQRLDGLGAKFDQRLDGLQAEFRQELHEHRRETRIAIGELRQEMQEGFRTMYAQMDTLTERMLVQTRWMVGSLTVIGALVTLLLTIGMFVK
jgi:tetrahydromethanopterin S-methyltransferase subunit G